MRSWKVFFVVLGPLLLGLFLGVMTMVAHPNSLKLGPPSARTTSPTPSSSATR